MYLPEATGGTCDCRGLSFLPRIMGFSAALSRSKRRCSLVLKCSSSDVRLSLHL